MLGHTKKYYYNFPIRKAIGAFVSAMFGFFMLSALGAYWALVLLERPAPVVTIRTTTVVPKEQTIKVFFSNSAFDPKMINCGRVYIVERKIAKTPNIAMAALKELLAGLSWDEANTGYFNSINPGVKVNSLSIANGVAHVDFDKRLNEGVAGSCKVEAIRAQITSTLKQFPGVDSVAISVDGDSETALQP